MKFCQWSKSSRNQLLAALSINIIALSHGMVLGWLSPVLPELLSENSPLATGPLTTEQTSWIGSIFLITGAISLLVCTYVSDHWGRKFALNFLGLPHLGYWIAIRLGTTYVHLYIARLISGLASGGVFGCITLYIAEIAEPNVRGSLGTIFQLFYNIGILVSYIIGNFASYRTFPLIAIVVPVCFTILVFFIPETPQSLLRRKKPAEAEAAFRFYRGIPKTETIPKNYAEEYTQMTNQINNYTKEKLQLKDFKTKPAIKGFIIAIVLMLLNQFSGCFAIVSYAATIYKDAGSSLNPNVAAIIMAVMQITGCYTSTLLIDRVGRKILLIVSTSAVSIGLAALGIFSYFSYHDEYDVTPYAVIPVISLSFVIFMACLGLFTVPFIIVAEVMPIKIRSFGTMTSLLVLIFCGFIVLKFFPIWNEVLQLYGCMFLFAGITALGAIFIVFVVPETKGKNLLAD